MRAKNKIAKAITSILVLLIIFLILSIISAINSQEKNNEVQIIQNAIINDEGIITLCFSMQNDCEETLAILINNSEKQTVATYDLDSQKIIETLQKKENFKSQNTDVVIDEDNYKEEWTYWQKISTSGLMHNKFFILESENTIPTIVTGSTNPTFNDFNKNDNNMLIISSSVLSNNYLDEFVELKNKKPQTKTKNTKVNLSGILIENYFCPEDGCEGKTILAIKNASSSIYFMTFSFTSDPIGEEIIMKHEKGIEVKGMFDASQVAANKKYSEFFKMNSSKLDVKIEKSKGKLHHKVFIIDNKTVVTGSYNPSASGNERNEENVLIIHDNRIAEEYLQEFERIWSFN